MACLKDRIENKVTILKILISLDYSRVEVASAARKWPMKL